MFGTPQTSTTTPFNAPSTSQTSFGFGASPNRMQSTFGQPAAFTANRPAQTTGFGVGASTSTGLFGTQTSTTPFFGTQPTTQTTPFGATTTATSPFGGGATSTSLFGGTNTAQTSTQSLFGQSSFPTTSFSSATGTNIMQPVGTTIKFNPLIGSDTMLKNNINTTISTRHQCITAMKEYETKSMEELRWEDYQANRKGGQAQSNMFGQPQTSSESLFGAATQQQQQPTAAATPFSSTSNSIFGKPTFGSPSTSLFNTGNTFGSQQLTTKPAFGTTATTTTFSFGPVAQQPVTVTSGASLFNPTPSFTPNTNFFQPPATATQPKSLFGTATTTTTPSLFGSNTMTAPKTGFGLPTTGASTFGSFGATSNTFSFNSNPTATTTTSLFSSSLGATVSTANTNPLNKSSNIFNFASNPVATPLFNTTNPTMTNFNTGNVFNTAATPNFFGAQATTNSLFSNPLQMQAQVPPMSLQQSLSQTMPTSELLMNRLQNMPYGDSPFQNITAANQSLPLKFSNDSKTLYQYKVSQKSVTSPKVPRNVSVPQTNPSFLFDGLDEDKHEEESKSALDIFAPRRNIKRLVLKPKDSTLNASITDSPSSLSMNQRVTNDGSKENVADNTVSELFSSNTNTNNQNNQNVGTPHRNSVTFGETSIMGDRSNNSSLLNVADSGDDNSLVCPSTPPPPLRCGFKLTKLDYYTKPSYHDLDRYYDELSDSCKVPSFTIGREGYGEIHWECGVDVKGLDVDEIVHIRRKEVIVYPDDDSKPSVGRGLNKPAQITLHQVWPVDKTTHEIIKDIDRLRTMRYAEKIEAATNKLEATFKEYRPETGSWVFCVKHFSKYGLIEDDEELPDKKEPIRPPPPPVALPPPPPAGSVGRLVLHKPSQSTQTKEAPAGFEPYEMQIGKSVVDSAPFHDKNSLNVSHISHISHLSHLSGAAGGFSAEFKDFSVDKVPEMFTSYYDSMRFALFSEEDDVDQIPQSSFKRPKRTSNTVEEKRFFKPLLEAPTSYVPKVNFVKKRDLVFEPDVFSSDRKLSGEINSVCHSMAPKIRFFNGSSNFTLINGRNVTIYNLDLISDISDQYSRFDTQLKENSIITSQDDDPPFIETKPMVHNKYNVEHLERFVEAFFGELNETTLYGQQHERINRVIDWLSERNRIIKKPKEVPARILHCLCCNDLKGAVDEALAGRMPKIAILLCSGNNLNVRTSIIKQLESWRKSGADAFIDKVLLKIYVVLSGGVSWITSTGDEIDVLEGATWTQQLCLMLVFSSLQEGLQECISNLTVQTNDIEYHLLARHSPFEAIDAASNYLEGWFLHQSLQSYKVIKNDVRSDLLHIIVWSQLISKDVLCACFVACHIKDDFLRNYAVSEAIIYNSPNFRPQDDTHLTSSLTIPKPLLARLKAVYYKNIFDHEKYAQSLLEGKEWSQAHDAFVDKIFPELVIYSNLATLRQIIDQLRDHREQIANWNFNGANVFDIYSQALISQSDANLDEFNAHLLKCENDRQTLCQSEMASKINHIMVNLRGGLYQLNTPIPPDYALKELNYNCRQLLKIISR